MRLGGCSGPQCAIYQEKALALFQTLGGRIDAFSFYAANRLVAETKNRHNVRAWQDAAISFMERGAAELPDEWEEPQRKAADQPGRHEVVSGLLMSLRQCARWEDFARVLEAEAGRKEPLTSILRSSTFGSYGQGAPLLGDAALRFPNMSLRWPRVVKEFLGVDHDAGIRATRDEPMDTAWLETLHDPWLKVVAQWRFGDAVAARAAIERRITRPDADLTDWWLAAWLAWEADSRFPDDQAEQQATLRAAERLARAASFPAEDIARRYLNAALLRAVLALHQRPAALVEAAHAAARRFCDGSVATTYDREDLIAAFQALGFTTEADRAKTLPVVPHPNESLALLNGLSADKAGPLVEKICRLSNNGWGGDVDLPKAAAALDLLTRWLRAVADSHRELPGSAVLPLQSLMLERKPLATELCRAALTIPGLADIAFGCLAEDALRNRRPLTEMAGLARNLLKAKAEWARGPRRSACHLDPMSRALPEDGIITQPGPALILIWDAWQRQAPREIDEVILPLLRDAGTVDEAAVRAGGDLFFCAPDKFIEAARRFVRNDAARVEFTGHAFTEPSTAGGTMDFITLIWQVTQPDVPIDELYLSELEGPAATSAPLDALANYIGLAGHMTRGQAARLVRDLRDRLVDRDPVRRRMLVESTRERSRYNQGPARWQRKRVTPSGTWGFVRFLAKLLAEPKTCRVALEMAIEDGLAGDATWRANDLRNAFTQANCRRPERLIALLDGYSMLSPAGDFRTWAMDVDPSGSLFDTAVGRLAGTMGDPDHGDSASAAMELVKSRRPETFGTGLVMAWAAALGRIRMHARISCGVSSPPTAVSSRTSLPNTGRKSACCSELPGIGTGRGI